LTNRTKIASTLHRNGVNLDWATLYGVLRQLLAERGLPPEAIAAEFACDADRIRGPAVAGRASAMTQSWKSAIEQMAVV
jgi:hypothetical protein